MHDAARPFPSLQLIDRVIDAVEVHGAAVPGLAVVDTIRYQDEAGMLVSGDVPRDRLLRMQTPQGFIRSHLLAASSGGETATDDAGLLLASGRPVAVVEGEETNIKVTTRADLVHARQIIAHREDRISEPSANESNDIAGSANER